MWATECKEDIGEDEAAVIDSIRHVGKDGCLAAASMSQFGVPRKPRKG